MIVLETKRLILRKLSPDDAEFVLELLNEPSFLHYIGDREVRNLEQIPNDVSAIVQAALLARARLYEKLVRSF